MKRNARLLLLIAVVGLSGCGGGSPQTTPPAIVVTITTAPPASLGVGGTAGVAATVVNDTANAGVQWSCTPSPPACGSFTLTSTASGASTTYTAPATAPAGGSAVIIATSVTDHAKNANASVMVVGIVVTLSTPPPTSLAGGGTASVAATVTNDSAAAGVNWSCTPSTTCGSFTPPSTASGASTTYTAPAVAPASGSVVIIATSATDPTKNAQSAAVTITGTASNATLNGQYVLHLTAATGNQGTGVIAASVTADGNGLITGGVEELTAPGFYDLKDVVTDGTYSIDPNGHGTMLIHTFQKETLKFSFVLTSPTHALMVEIDGDPASGTLDKQQPAGTGGFTAAQILGNYSFLLDGIDNTAPLNHMSVAGTFAADGISALTNGTLDMNNGGVFTTTSFAGTFTAPDSNGRGHLILDSGRDFVYYIISSKVLRLLEGDNISFVGGSAYAQGSAGSTMAALSGKFVYQHHGWSAPGRTVAVGQLSADGMGNVTTGVSDSNSGGLPTTVTKGTMVAGMYMISGSPSGTLTLTDAAGTSTFNLYLVDPALNILDPSNSSGGGGALLLHTDASIIGTGVLIPQVVSGSPTFSQNRALNLINSITSLAFPNEIHLVGRLVSDGAANFTGSVDYGQNSFYSPPSVVTGNTLSGMFAADSVSPGHFTGSLTLASDPTNPLWFPFISPTISTFNVSYYQASSSQALVIQTDTSADAWGYLLQQQLP
ncbi:MAG: hypothetical protein AUG46_04065 [Acidobacteria bacterium 13_1_20CM_3_58_11]|nr:MAG: hypothetical protein AUG46_04065 [Acidobacteria bacterium 13_1_20CM_3_58_11]